MSETGIILPGGVDFDSPGGKRAFLAALQTKVASNRAREAAKAERQRERDRDRDPIHQAYGRDAGEVVDDEPEFLGDDERENERDEREDETDGKSRSALTRFFRPRSAKK